METTQISKQETFMGKEDLLNHWLGHRNLTRRVIEKFPEKELFEFSVEGMRPFSDMVKELLSIAGPGLYGIVNRSEEAYNHDLNLNTKAELLAKWDEETPVIIDLYNKIPEKIFQKL